LEELAGQACIPVHLTRRAIQNYYHGFCNRTLWPLFHYFTQYAEYDERMWNSYVDVNRLFADVVLKNATEDDTIWVQDYQLLLLPEMIRQKLPGAEIGLFLHIPFPSSEIFRLLPWRTEILEGLMGADLIGFHTYDYARHFLSSVRQLLGHDVRYSQVTTGRRVVRADVFPMGIDYERYAGSVEQPDVQRALGRMLQRLGDRRSILSIDRLDYSKGIIERLEAFDRFLSQNPKYREQVTFILVAVPSRTGVSTYRDLKRRIDEHVGQINGKYGTIGWTPIWYMYRSLPFDELVALYALSDVALITPVRDGMNLIAKEFVATKTDGQGVLILSEMAGAAQELGEAIIVNPNNEREMARAIKEALELPPQEQEARNIKMQARLRRYNVERWANDFVDRLSHTRDAQHQLESRRLTRRVRAEMAEAYRTSGRRLLLLDYDGTLMPFNPRPDQVQPDGEVLEILEQLTADPNNRTVIVSGRDRHTLDRWLGQLDLDIIAEHGVWIRHRGQPWETIEALDNQWKDEIRPLLRVYVDRTPGSFLEEKEFSLVWHYRRANPELATVRVNELREALRDLTSNLNVGVLEGNKVLEVKNAGINKGTAALRWLGEHPWDFVLAVGDDWTDEDTFEILPETAYSVKVGLYPSRARFNVSSTSDVRRLLQMLTRSTDQRG
jgi:trehalose 6-phosphate synthase/phosphatase